jgi:hypothetical protein
VTSKLELVKNQADAKQKDIDNQKAAKEEIYK